MTQDDLPAFSKILRRMLTVYEMPWNDEVTDVWWHLMQDLTIEQFAAACKHHLTHSPNRPRPAHILAQAKPPRPDPDRVIAMAKAKTDVIGIVAYAHMRDWLGLSYYEQRQRAMEFLERWDEHVARANTGALTRDERHYLRHYGIECVAADKKLTQEARCALADH